MDLAIGICPLLTYFAQAMVGFCRRFVERLLVTRFRIVISPTAGGFALGFLLSFSMPGAWRAVAGAVAEGTTPIKAVGDSLLRMPIATWMLMGLAVFPGTWSGDVFDRLREV